MVTATGKGFKNGTSLIVFFDVNKDNIPALGAGDVTLCSALVGSDDVGSCEFEVTNPPIEAGTT